MTSLFPQPEGIKPANIQETMTAKCQHQDFPCVNISYSRFDEICANELRDPVSAGKILNERSFCVNIPINESLRLEDLETSDYLRGLKGKIGLYHLWVDYDECDEHNMNTLLCVYVGKGLAGGRVMEHIRQKYRHLDKLDTIFCTFYECHNRIAKYLEQLFLDLYGFESNKNENIGSDYLFGVWDRQRYLHGTELDLLADTISAGHGLGSDGLLRLGNSDG